MTPQILLVFAILAVAVVLLVTEWIPMEVTALLTLGAVALTGLVQPAQALSGFSNPAVVTVWAVFILSGGLTRTGVANRLGRHVLRLAGAGEARMVAVLTLTAGGLSALMNNVAVAAMMLPVTMDIARRTNTPPSRLLMRLAYGSLLGGLTTLIGTPPNILVSDALRDAGLRPFRIFDFTPLGVAVLLTGTAFMVLVGRHLLPKRDVAREASERGALDLHEQYHLKERVFLLRVPEASPLVGQSLAQVRLGAVLGLQVLGINRRGQQQLAPTASEALHGGDLLLVSGRLERLEVARGWRDLSADTTDGLDALLGDTVAISQAQLAEDSELCGKTLLEVGFHDRFGVNVLGLRREGVPSDTDLANEPLAAGDWLLVEGPREKVDALKGTASFAELKPVPAAELRDTHRLHEHLFLTEVPTGSPHTGKTLADCALADPPGLRLLEIIRADGSRIVAAPEVILAEGDRALVFGRPGDFNRLQGIVALEVEREVQPDLSHLETERIGLMEVVLAPRSMLAGKRVSELQFREKSGLSLLALWRGGRPYRSNLRDMEVRPGDALLFYGPRERLRQLGSEGEFLVLTAAAQELPRFEKANLSMFIMAAVLVAALTGLTPIYIAAVVGAALMVLARCLTMEEAYRAIEWKAVFLIAGLLPLGVALHETGAAQLVAERVMGAVGGFGPVAVLAALMGITFVATSIVPTAALVLLMAPIVLSTAAQLQLSPHALMMGVAMAASASFTSPVSHPANVLVMGPGGYRFSDYLKIGIPLSLLVFIVVMLVLPWLWPLRG
jgi:di/tricarboxylate transporter